VWLLPKSKYTRLNFYLRQITETMMTNDIMAHLHSLDMEMAFD